jgi:ATP-binding cassette, subfamily B, bacterial
VTDTEERLEGFSTGAELSIGKAMRALFREVPVFRLGLGLTVFLAVASTALPVAIPVLVQQTIDNEILAPGGVDLTGALGRSGLVVLGMVAAAFARRSATFRLARTAAHGLSDLRVKVFSHLQGMSALHVQSERRGALVARVTSDVFRIQDFMEWGGMGLMLGSAQLILVVAAMLFYRWQLAVLVVVGVAVYGVMLFWFQRVLGRGHDRVRARVSDSMSAVGESISGVHVVRAYGVERATLQRVRSKLDAQAKAEFKTASLGSALFSSAEIFAGSLTAAVVAAGIWLGAERGMTAGSLLAFLFLVNLLVDPVQTVVETLDSAQAAASGLRRVLGVLDTPVDLADPGDSGADLPHTPLTVEVRDLTFRYPTGDTVLDGITFDIPAGRRVAVVGETGSGKTTLAKVVVRLLDAGSGEVRVGGIPVDRIRFDSLRARVAYVPQEGFLFDTSIADNVRYGKPGADDEELLRGFADLGLSDWLAGVPNGLDTQVGERGSLLSTGERQLVALVRAWMSQPDLLVLDEATSAVDPALELKIRDAIDRLIRGRTSITIAHRLSTAEASDEVLVLDRGRLVERGSHPELIALGGVYAGLHADWMAGTR